MKQQAGSQDDPQIQQISQAYGSFLRSVVAPDYPQAAGLSLDAFEQLTQDKLKAALEQAKLDEERSLFRIAVATGLEAVRTAKQQPDGQSLLWIDLQHTNLPPNPETLSQTIQEALARLPDNRRRVVGLHLAGLTIAEICDLLGWSENKIRQQLTKGLRTLHTTLQAAGINYEVD